MRTGNLSKVLAIVALVALVMVQPVGGNGDDQYDTPEKPELKYLNLGYHLDRMVVRVESGEDSAEEAAEDASISQDGAVAVTIYLSGNVTDVVTFLENKGGDPRNVGEDYIEAYVPVTLLGLLSEQPGVLRVREIVPPPPGQSSQSIAGHGPRIHGSPTWNRAGYSGQGIEVGVIDLGFKSFRQFMGTELPATVEARCYTDVGLFTENLADCEVDSDHGTMVAESLLDVAPEVSLYIARPRSWGDLQAAVDWMVSEGVSVINHSIGWHFDGPGDGTSPYRFGPSSTVDRAVSGGTVWINSAGNSAYRTWFGPPNDEDGDGFIEFKGPFEANLLVLDEGFSTVTVQLRWEGSWGSEDTDLDLFLYDVVTGEVIWASAAPQSGAPGHDPYEWLRYPVYSGFDYHVVVRHYSGSLPEWMQLVVWMDGSIQYYTGSYSITNPAESANPGLLAVGAARWHSVHTISPNGFVEWMGGGVKLEG